MFDEVPRGAVDANAGHGHGGVGKYLIVFGSLAVLTAISFLIGNSPIMNTPSIGWTGMLAVSCAKAMLVILFFMHLKWEANWKYVLTIPASIMSIFLLIMLVWDIGRRTHYYSEDRWQHAAEPHADHPREWDEAEASEMVGASESSSRGESE